MDSMGILENAISHSIELHEESVALLEIFQTKCSDQNRKSCDIKFIADNLKTLRSNEKLIGLYRSIVEEKISMAIKSGNDCAGASIPIQGEDEDPVDMTDEDKYLPDAHDNRFYIEEHVNLTDQRVRFKDAVTVVHFQKETTDATANESSPIPLTGEMDESNSDVPSNECEVDEEDEEEQYHRRGDGHSSHIEELVDYGDPHVRPMDGTHCSNGMFIVESLPSFATDEGSSTSTTDTNKPSDPKEEPNTKPRLFGKALRKARRMKKVEHLKRRKLTSPLVPAPRPQPQTVQLEMDNSDASERDDRIGFKRKLKRTGGGRCLVCDERKSYSRLQWQLHLLSHTKENFYFCKRCGQTFPKRHQHDTCPSALITDIYEQYNCVGDNYLAAFVCNICDYVRVSESRMMKHLNMKHNVKGNSKHFFKKCHVVTDL